MVAGFQLLPRRMSSWELFSGQWWGGWEGLFSGCPRGFMLLGLMHGAVFLKLF